MRRLTLFIVLCAAVLASSTAASTARAGGLLGLFTNCGSTSEVFAAAPWYDTASYYLAPNGGFENGSTSWHLSGSAAVASGNDPWDLSGDGSHALTVASGGSATTNVCYGLTYPAIRFTAAGVGGPATIHVRVVAHSLLGILSILDGGTVTVPEGWDAPKISTFWSAVAAPLGTSYMQVQITGVSGTAQVDDLYVDPFLTRQ